MIEFLKYINRDGPRFWLYNISQLDTIWWFKHRFLPKHRYHVIRTGFKPGWRDKDSVLCSVIREIATDFWIKECKEVANDWGDSQSNERQKRLTELLIWFKENPYDESYNRMYAQKLIHPTDLGFNHRKWEEEWTEKCRELLLYRDLMWT